MMLWNLLLSGLREALQCWQDLPGNKDAITDAVLKLVEVSPLRSARQLQNAFRPPCMAPADRRSKMA